MASEARACHSNLYKVESGALPYRQQIVRTYVDPAHSVKFFLFQIIMKYNLKEIKVFNRMQRLINFDFVQFLPAYLREKQIKE